VASQRVAQAGCLKRQELSPYARVGLGRYLRSTRFDAAQSSRFAALSVAQRNGQSWISHNRQKRGRLSSAATGRVRPLDLAGGRRFVSRIALSICLKSRTLAVRDEDISAMHYWRSAFRRLLKNCPELERVTAAPPLGTPPGQCYVTTDELDQLAFGDATSLIWRYQTYEREARSSRDLLCPFRRWSTHS
jgi:hypothetical protein